MDHSFGITINTITVAAIALVTMLTACSAPQTGTPIPTAQIIDIYYAPELDFLRTDISSCIEISNTIVPYLHEQFTDFTNLQSGGIVLRLGEADWIDNDFFITQISSQHIHFIINSSNPKESIDINELKAIYSGRQSSWFLESENEEPITVWVYPEVSDLSFWIKNTLIGSSSLAVNSKLAPNPESVIEAISQDEAGIGYLPEAWMERSDQQIKNNIKVLKVEDDDDLLSPLPVLAYLSKKPSGAVRDFLVCLQDT